jgi:hypothetical protein
LLNADLSNQKHLPKAIEPLRAKGEAQFEEAKRIIETLAEGELNLLWTAQERNRDVQSFDELVTKQEFKDAQRLVSTAVVHGLNFEDSEPAEQEQEQAAEAQETVAEDVVAAGAVSVDTVAEVKN